MAENSSEHWVPIKTARLLIEPASLDPDVIADTFETRSFESVYKWRFVTNTLSCPVYVFLSLGSEPDQSSVRSHDDHHFILLQSNQSPSTSVHPKWETHEDAIKWTGAKINFPTDFAYTISLIDDSTRPPNCPRHFGTTGLTSSSELGYQFHPATWGRGYATEAVRALLDHVFLSNPALTHLSEVCAWIAAENVASAHVIGKLGFVKRDTKAVDDVGDVGGVVEGDTLELSDETVAEVRKAVVEMGVDQREGQWERPPPRWRKQIDLECWVMTKEMWKEKADGNVNRGQ